MSLESTDYEKYHIPDIYSWTHYLLGGVSIFIPSLIIGFYFYQFGQLALDCRVFLLDRKIEQGNHLPHTLRKVSQFLIGMMIVYLIGILLTKN